MINAKHLFLLTFIHLCTNCSENNIVRIHIMPTDQASAATPAPVQQPVPAAQPKRHCKKKCTESRLHCGFALTAIAVILGTTLGIQSIHQEYNWRDRCAPDGPLDPTLCYVPVINTCASCPKITNSGSYSWYLNALPPSTKTILELNSFFTQELQPLCGDEFALCTQKPPTGCNPSSMYLDPDLKQIKKTLNECGK